MFELVESGVGAAFGGNTKEAQACIVVWCGKCGGCYAYTVSGPQGEGECRWGGCGGGGQFGRGRKWGAPCVGGLHLEGEVGVTGH